jgi:hypothetical protein
MGSERIDYAPKKPLICAVVPAERSYCVLFGQPLWTKGLEQRRDRHSTYLSPLGTLPLRDLERWHAKGHKASYTFTRRPPKTVRYIHLYNSYRFREPQSHLSTGSLRLSTALR